MAKRKYRIGKIKDFTVFNINGKIIRCYNKKWQEFLLQQGYKMSLYYKGRI